MGGVKRGSGKGREKVGYNEGVDKDIRKGDKK